eukprot:1511174-Amphidinium_carterae.1
MRAIDDAEALRVWSELSELDSAICRPQLRPYRNSHADLPSCPQRPMSMIIDANSTIHTTM